jgi:hypothetical protein
MTKTEAEGNAPRRRRKRGVGIQIEAYVFVKARIFTTEDTEGTERTRNLEEIMVSTKAIKALPQSFAEKIVRDIRRVTQLCLTTNQINDWGFNNGPQRWRLGSGAIRGPLR